MSDSSASQPINPYEPADALPVRSTPDDKSPVVQVSLSLLDWQGLRDALNQQIHAVRRGRFFGDTKRLAWLRDVIHLQTINQAVAIEAIEDIHQAALDHPNEPLLAMEKIHRALGDAGRPVEWD